MSELAKPIYYSINDIEVDTVRDCLTRGEQKIELRQKSFQVLLYLMEHRLRTVTKEELMENVWPDTAVTTDALVQCIVNIRYALGDDSRHPRFVKTISRVGYRFIGPVEERWSAEPAAAENEGFTSLEIEVEECITSGERREGESRRMKGLSHRSPTLPVPRWRHRVALISILVVILIVAVPLFTYLGRAFWHSNLPQVDITLPQVPGKKSYWSCSSRTSQAATAWIGCAKGWPIC